MMRAVAKGPRARRRIRARASSLPRHGACTGHTRQRAGVSHAHGTCVGSRYLSLQRPYAAPAPASAYALPALPAAMCSSAGARRVKLLQLTYDVSLVPPGGAQVVASVGTFLKTAGKDAAGHAFHHFSLLQAGLLGATARRIPNCSCCCVCTSVRARAGRVGSGRACVQNGSSRATATRARQTTRQPRTTAISAVKRTTRAKTGAFLRSD